MIALATPIGNCILGRHLSRGKQIRLFSRSIISQSRHVRCTGRTLWSVLVAIEFLSFARCAKSISERTLETRLSRLSPPAQEFEACLFPILFEKTFSPFVFFQVSQEELPFHMCPISVSGHCRAWRRSQYTISGRNGSRWNEQYN